MERQFHPPLTFKCDIAILFNYMRLMLTPRWFLLYVRRLVERLITLELADSFAATGVFL